MSSLAAPAAGRIALLEDGSLAVSADPAVREMVEAWLPRIPAGADPSPRGAMIRVGPGDIPAPPSQAEPDMRFFDVQGWIDRARERILLADLAGRIGARVELAPARAEVWIGAAGGAPDWRDVFATLTMSAALLLTRLERALMHAAAVVAPGGGAWLLPGGSFNGKTSTCSTLVRGGWSYLCDDHAVLGDGAGGGVRAEGWPRPFHLDVGYLAGRSEGVRARVDPDALAPGAWRRTAPVAGLLFPRVEAERPTRLSRLHPAAALGRMVAESPWLLADATGAGPVLALLERTARLPAYELRLGRDCYCNPDRLQMVLKPATCNTDGPNGVAEARKASAGALTGPTRLQ